MRPMIPIIVPKTRVLKVLRVKVEVPRPLVHIADATGVRCSDSCTIVRVGVLVSTEICKSAVIVEEGRVAGPSLVKPATVLVMDTVTELTVNVVPARNVEFAALISFTYLE